MPVARLLYFASDGVAETLEVLVIPEPRGRFDRAASVRDGQARLAASVHQFPVFGQRLVHEAAVCAVAQVRRVVVAVVAMFEPPYFRAQFVDGAGVAVQFPPEIREAGAVSAGLGGGGGGEMAVRGEVGGESAADFARQMREEFREAFGGFAACGVRAGRLGECREQGVRIGCVVRLGGVRRGVCVPTGEFAGVLLRRHDEAHAKFVQASPDCRHEVGDAVGTGEGCAFGGGEEALDGVLVGVRRVEGVEASAAQACEEDAVEGVPDGRGDGGALGDAAEFGRAGGGVPREQDDGFVRIAAISHFGPLSFVVWGFTMKPATPMRRLGVGPPNVWVRKTPLHAGTRAYKLPKYA